MDAWRRKLPGWLRREMILVPFICGTASVLSCATVRRLGVRMSAFARYYISQSHFTQSNSPLLVVERPDQSPLRRRTSRHWCSHRTSSAAHGAHLQCFATQRQQHMASLALEAYRQPYRRNQRPRFSVQAGSWRASARCRLAAPACGHRHCTTVVWRCRGHAECMSSCSRFLGLS